MRHFDEGEVFEAEFNIDYFRRLLVFLKPYLRTVLTIFLMIVVISMADIAGPVLIQKIIDEAIAVSDIQLVFLFGGVFLALQIVIYFASRMQTMLLHTVGQNVIYDLRKALFDHIQDLSLRFFDGRPAGKIMVRITNDVQNLNELLTVRLVQVLNDFFTLGLIIVVMLRMDWRLALMSFIVLPVLIYLAVFLRNKVRQRWRDVRRKRANLNAFLQESISGMRTIQAFTREESSISDFTAINQDYTKAQIDAEIASALFRPAVEISSAFGSVVVFAYGAYAVLQGNLSVGVLVAFIKYIDRFWQPIMRMSNFYNQMLVAMASAERVFDILDTKPAIQNTSKPFVLEDIEGEVEFRNVHFSYVEGVKVLNDVSFRVKPGESVALVGPTGAGKTTVVNLIPRFYDVQEGGVYVDGHDVKDVDMDSLRNRIAFVLQEPLIFSGSVKDNIRYARPSATDEEVIEAAKIANAHQFIMEFEDGYDTEVQERGSRLSVGQRQLISFARAILADPRILILDEATSSIDTHTEQLIQEAIDRVLANRTSFIIAHRLSTIRKADRIFVIAEGKIIEEGTHEELMNQRGVYFNLNRIQYESLLTQDGIASN